MMNPINEAGPDSTRLLGPEGVQQRMAEIQRRMDSVLGRPSFASYFSTVPNPLKGSIGGSVAPFNPLGGAANLQSKASPELQSMINAAAQQNGVDPILLDALVSTESAYDPNARSKTGALGLCQLMPGTASQLGIANPLDPQQNLNGGAKYLGRLLQQFGGNTPLALAAYNAGPNAVSKAGNQIPPYAETQKYVEKIMDIVNARRSQ